MTPILLFSGNFIKGGKTWTKLSWFNQWTRCFEVFQFKTGKTTSAFMAVASTAHSLAMEFRESPVDNDKKRKAIVVVMMTTIRSYLGWFEKGDLVGLRIGRHPIRWISHCPNQARAHCTHVHNNYRQKRFCTISSLRKIACSTHIRRQGCSVLRPDSPPPLPIIPCGSRQWSY